MYLSSVNRGMAAAADDDPDATFRNPLELGGYSEAISLSEALVSASDMKKDAIETKGTKLYADEAKKLNVALTHLLNVRSDHLTASNYASVVEDYYSKVTGSEDVESTSLSVFKTEKPRAGTKDLDDIYLNNTSGGVRVFCDTGLHPGFSINFKDSVVDVQTAGNVIDKGTGGHGCGETYPAKNTTVEFIQDDLAAFGFRDIRVNIRREGDIYIITITRGGAEGWVLEERVDINFVRKSGGTNFFAGNDKKNTFLKGVITSIAANIVNVEKWLTAKELGDLLQAMLAIKYARNHSTITCFGFSNDRGYIGRLLRWSPANLGAVYNNPGKKDGCVKSHFMRRKQNERLFKILLRQIKLCAQQIVEHNSNIIYIINMALSIKDLPIKTTGKITRTLLVDRLLECIKDCIESANSTVRKILDAAKTAFEAANENNAIIAVNALNAALAPPAAAPGGGGAAAAAADPGGGGGGGAAAAADPGGGGAAAFAALKAHFVALLTETIRKAAAAALAPPPALAAAGGAGGGAGGLPAAHPASPALLPSFSPLTSPAPSASASAGGAPAAPAASAAIAPAAAAPALSATAEAKERAKDVCDILTQHKVVNIFTVAVNDRGKTVGIVINKNITRLFVEPKADTLRPDDKLYRITYAGASFMNWDLHSLFGSSHNHALILRNMDCAYVPTSRRSLVRQAGGGPCKNILKQKGGGEENRSRKEYNVDKQVYNALKQVISSTTPYLRISMYDADNDPEAPNGFNRDDDIAPGYSDERFYRGKSLPPPDCINSILLEDPYSTEIKNIISGDAAAAAAKVAAAAPGARERAAAAAAEAAAEIVRVRAVRAAEGTARIRAEMAEAAAVAALSVAAAGRATAAAPAIRERDGMDLEEAAGGAGAPVAIARQTDRSILFLDNDVVCNCCRIPENTTYNSYLRNRYSDDYIFNLNSFDVIKAEKIDDVNISPDRMTVRSIMSKMELYFNNPRTNCAFTSPMFYFNLFDRILRGNPQNGRYKDILDINVVVMNNHIDVIIDEIKLHFENLLGLSGTHTATRLPSQFEIQQFAHGNTLAIGSNPAEPINYYKSYLLKKYGYLEVCSKNKEIEAVHRRMLPLARYGQSRGAPPQSDGFGDELAAAVSFYNLQTRIINQVREYISDNRIRVVLNDEEIYSLVQQYFGKPNMVDLLKGRIKKIAIRRAARGRGNLAFLRDRDSGRGAGAGGSGAAAGARSRNRTPGGGLRSDIFEPLPGEVRTGSSAFTPGLMSRIGGGARKSRKNKTRKANNRKYNRRTRRNKH